MIGASKRRYFAALASGFTPSAKAWLRARRRSQRGRTRVAACVALAGKRQRRLTSACFAWVLCVCFHPSTAPPSMVMRGCGQTPSSRLRWMGISCLPSLSICCLPSLALLVMTGPRQRGARRPWIARNSAQ